ncbi:hypothetical protein a10_01644 [Streptomyces acidiscabies]|nr:hypothetical protein a10_01644 [Streptomyces acidiscabies]
MTYTVQNAVTAFSVPKRWARLVMAGADAVQQTW